MQQVPYVVLDVGSGCTKLGFAGNLQPSYSLPTVLATRHADRGKLVGSAASRSMQQECESFIGDDALNNNTSAYQLSYPMRQSVVSVARQRYRPSVPESPTYVHLTIYRYLRVDPEDHCVLLTQPLSADPDTRKQMAEIMFETFGVAGLYLGLQAVLSLYAAVGINQAQAALLAEEQASGTPAASTFPLWQRAGERVLERGLDPEHITGVVVDVGEGSTSVIPVMQGFVARSCARSIGVGGRDLTQHVQQAIRSNGSGVPGDMSWEVARKVKESHCYVCVDPTREVDRLAHKAASGASQKTFSFQDPKMGDMTVSIPLGHELFTASELLFTSPPTSALSTPGSLTMPSGVGITSRPLGGWQPLPELVDRVVQSCPIDARRGLYANMALCGGTACIRNLDKRMKPIDVQALSGPWARSAAWLGGSLLSGGGVPTEALSAATTSRSFWQEHGCLMDDMTADI